MDLDAGERLDIVDLLTGIAPMVPNAGAPLRHPALGALVDVGRTAFGGVAHEASATNGFGKIADVRKPAFEVSSLSEVAVDEQ